MKRKLIGAGVVAALIVGVAAVVWADTRHWAGFGQGHGWCAGRMGGGPLGFAARELDLSTAQREQIAAMWKAERPQVAALVSELATESAEMRAARTSGASGGVEAIAQRQGATVAKLIEEKEKLRGEIYAQVLNADQRTKADEFEQRWQSRLGTLAQNLAQPEGQRPGGEK